MNNGDKWGVKMKLAKIVILLGSFIVVLALTSCGGSRNREGQAQVPSSARDFQRESFQDVISELENAGFTNISTEILDDLITGWLISDGSVNQVSINGNTNFRLGDWFPTYAEIIVTYHTFPIRDTDTGDLYDDETDEHIVQVHTEQPDEEIVDQDDEILEILTIDNNAALALLFSPQTLSDRDGVLEFAEMYRGRIIEFDGFISDSWGDRPNYRTVRFWFGDYETDEAEANRIVALAMDSVSVQNFPAILRTFQNVRVIAKVEGAELGSGLGTIQLSPISIRFR